MYLNNGIKASFLLTLLTLVGCEKQVTFAPKEGDEKRYWVYTHTTQDIAQGYDTSMISESLVHYRVDEVGDTLKLHITPEHLQFSAGYSSFSSVELSSSQQKMVPFFQDGFDVSYNMETGEQVEFKGRNQAMWDELVKKRGDVVLNNLKSTMNAPGLLQSLPTKVGRQVTLDNFNGRSVTLTVNQLTESTLFATVSLADKRSDDKQADDPQTPSNAHHQLYGKLEIDRATGWVNSLNLVMNVPVDVYGETKVTQTTVAMRSEEQPIGAFSDIFAHAYYDDELYWYDIEPIPEAILVKGTTVEAETGKNEGLQDQLTQDDVMPYEQGMFNKENTRSDGQGFRLAFPTQIPPNQVVGHIAMRDVRAYTNNGDKIDLKLVTPNALQFFDENMNVNAMVQPIGWNKGAELKEISTFAAHIDYYKGAIELHSLPWQGGSSQSYQVGDLQVAIKKVPGAENEYRVEYHNSEYQWLGFTIGGVQGQMAFSPPKTGPEWLSPGSRQLFVQSTPPELITRTMSFKFSEEPKELMFIVHSQNETPSFSQDVEFLDREWYLASAEMPPMTNNLNREYYPLESDNVVEQSASAFDFHADHRVATESLQNAVVALPMEWAALCQFDIVNAPQVNGKPLEWKPQSEVDNDLPGGPVTIEPNTIAFQLMTPDGVRRYFYDMAITTRFTCAGKTKWNQMSPPSSPKPWLIDISAIEGFDAKQTVADFLGRYRILDQHGQKLVPIDKQGEVLTASDRLLSEILFAPGYLKMSGSISRIEEVVVQGAPLEKQFVVQFPPLPKG
ncbi:hypothetical protein OTK51_08175 [Vibrio scophthalmi]|uniref:hypothetical protein n=1 Tax=Vibrio scophthalmi TaxID=45658 RepID=UPI002284E12C|nr:hypothetical protein [Vibrio scophthalmi]MCY9803410.1 hypothetical protein [Vibrio scophthalmi]